MDESQKITKPRSIMGIVITLDGCTEHLYMN